VRRAARPVPGASARPRPHTDGPGRVALRQPGVHGCTCCVARAQAGCRLFAQWGWTTGDPDLEYAVVPCPPAFTAHVQAAFGAEGPADAADAPPLAPRPPRPPPTLCPTDNNCACAWATAAICSGAGDGSVCFLECCCRFAPSPPSSTSSPPPAPPPASPAPPLPPAPPGGYLPPPPTLPPLAPASSLPVATIAAGATGGGLAFLLILAGAIVCASRCRRQGRKDGAALVSGAKPNGKYHEAEPRGIEINSAADPPAYA
jgi:hypothetical protein